MNNKKKYLLKKPWNKLYFNKLPYLHFIKSKLIIKKNYDFLYNTKLYNLTQKRLLRMGKGKGKIFDQGYIIKGNIPLLISNKNKIKEKEIIKRIFINKLKKWNNLDLN